MPLAFRDEIRQVDLTQLPFSERLQILLVVSNEDKQFDTFRFAQNHHVEYQNVPSLGDWNYVDDLGGILLPHKLVSSIVTWFSK